MAIETYKIKIDVETQTASIRDLRGQIVATKVPVKELKQEFGNFAKTVNATKFKQFNRELQGTKGVAGGMRKFQRSTGGAATSVLELGRVVSDAPYGIRGMANNVSQLASNMLFGAQQIDKATGKAVGFGNVIKGMGKAFIGPLGILFAIQAVVAAVDFFYGGMKKAEEATDDTTSAIEKQKEELIDLTKEYKKYLKIKELVFQGAVKEREMLAALTSASLDTQYPEDRRIEALDKLIELYPKYFKGLKVTDIGKMLEAEDAVNKVLENRAKLKRAETDASIIANKIQLELIKKKADANYKDNLVELYEEQKQARELMKIYATLDLEFKDEDDKDRKKVSILDLTLVDPAEEEKKAKKYGKKLIKAIERFFGVEMKKDPLKIVPELDFLHTAQTQAKIDAYQKSVMDGLVKASELEDLQERIEMVKGALSTITDFTDSEFEREMTIEQNKTNALNNELNKRLQNEDLSKNQRQSIQNQIAQNDEKLRIKQEAIERKKFKMQKAANIANALMDTYSAAAGVLADTKGGSFARIAGMIATIGAGLAQVAAISRQKFQSSAGGSPAIASGSNGDSGAGERTDPAFNIVGMGSNNQLLEAIQAQFDKPLKAYVVSREVTRQQNLDAAINTGASL